MKAFIAPIVLATVFSVSAALAAPKPKAVNYDTRAKQCQAAVKGLYSGDGRVTAYGFCLSNVAQPVWNGGQEGAPAARR
jgi:hypothetical protein